MNIMKLKPNRFYNGLKTFASFLIQNAKAGWNQLNKQTISASLATRNKT